MRAPDFMYAVPPQEVIDLARKRASAPKEKLSRPDLLTLAKIAACPLCCGLYIEEKAAAMAKTVVYTRCGRLIEPVPDEQEGDFTKTPTNAKGSDHWFTDSFAASWVLMYRIRALAHLALRQCRACRKNAVRE